MGGGLGRGGLAWWRENERVVVREGEGEGEKAKGKEGSGRRSRGEMDDVVEETREVGDDGDFESKKRLCVFLWQIGSSSC